MKKYRLQTTALMSCKQTAIPYKSLGVLQPNKYFRAPLAWANMMILRFYPLAPSSTENKVGKELTDFF